MIGRTLSHYRIIEKKQKQNGWFEDCDNTMKHNDRPILHTIAYTIDGLIDAGVHLNKDQYKEAAIRAAARLKELFLRDGYLHGRYDSGWRGSEYMIVTGCAQMSIAWMKIFVLNGDKDYLNASVKMNDLLVRIQDRKVHETDKTLGAVPGSFPGLRAFDTPRRLYVLIRDPCSRLIRPALPRSKACRLFSAPGRGVYSLRALPAKGWGAGRCQGGLICAAG